jgi:DNA-binding response OmpR family regulator
MALEQTDKKTQHIFIVEDEESIGKVVLQVLTEELPCEVQLFPNGLLALEAAEKVRPDLLVLNYNLPHMNGIEFYDLIHKKNTSNAIPTIMISARLPYEEIGKRRIISIEKPFDLDHLIETVKTSLAL